MSPERARNKLRATAASLVHPFVSGLDIVPVVANDGAAEGLVVVVVPPSPDAPHLLGGQDKFGCPFRDGATTRWMRERDLEAAYRERWNRRTDEHQHIREAFDDLRQQVDLDRFWIAGVARPRVVGPATTGDRTAEDVTTALKAALTGSARLISGQRFGRDFTIKNLDAGALNPRVGLRRWIASSSVHNDPNELTKWAYAEIHHDGTIAFTCAVDGWFEAVVQDIYNLPTTLAESFCVDMVALVDTLATQSGATQRVAIEIDVLRREPEQKIAPVSRWRMGGHAGNLEVPPGARMVRSFRPVVTDLTAPAADEDLVAAARALAHDVLHQFGIARLATIPE